ncbi:MAG: radical SAM protein, partial [bacterium]|nr:radical SAM protein [bacterium]
GLDDVAFHVDLTQERAGYLDEKALNTLRREYIRRCEGLGLRVLFNTTIFDGNVAELPDLARFFRDQAANVRLAGFNLQAETGRGVAATRTDTLTINRVAKALETGTGTTIDFDVAEIGHAACARYGALVVAGNKATSALANRSLFEDLLARLETHQVTQDATTMVRPSLHRVYARYPGLALRSLAFLLGRLWRLRGGLWKSRGRVHTLTLIIHSFMDANQLDANRCASCVFMVATENGPTSMCVHNARRDEDIFAPVNVGTERTPQWWHPSTGR